MEPDSPALEQIWRELRPHLEWAQGFALIFLFAGHPQPVELLRRRLEESLQLRSLRLNFIAPAIPDETPRAVEQILAARPDPGRGPLRVELWRGSEEEDWPQARRQALRRLNERRFLLERDVALPIVVVLPREDRGRVYVEAPDLWAVRSYTAQLPTPTDLPRATEVVRSDGYVPALGAPPGPIELEWARLLKTTKDRGRLNPWDGFAAIEAATDRGDLAAAQAIASQTIHICRERVEASSETLPEARNQSLRDLSIALYNVGRVERDLGNLEAARTAYRESLELLRRLRDALGDTPQALHDLSISLDNVGWVERDLGNLEAARTAYRESLELFRRLREAFGDTPQALRDLYRESLEIAERLSRTFPDNPQYQRDLTWIEARANAPIEQARS